MNPNNDKTKMIQVIKDNEGNEIQEEICSYFEVTQIIKKIPENIENDEVEIQVNNGSFFKSFRIDLENISDINYVMKICSKNYLIVQNNFRNLVYSELLRQTNSLIAKNKFNYEHKCLGWVELNGKNIFLLDRTNLMNGYFSKCIRSTGTFVKGNEDEYDKMLEENVFNNTSMTLAYMLGFCSVVSSLISDDRDVGVLIVGLTGRSTTGKTTALKLMASIWGDPSELKGTTILRNNASEKAFTTQCSGLYGYPILWDDLFTNSKIKVDDFLYEKSKGTQRVVSTTNGDNDFSRMGYSGLVAITGEESLVEKTNGSMGLYARIIDFHEISWTSSGQNATEIKNVISQNYGFKAKPYVEYIQSLEKSYLLEDYDECVEIVNSRIKFQDDFTDRISKKYAIILLTIKLVNKCFNLTLDENQIIDFALKIEEEQYQERDKGRLAYEFIYSYYMANKNKFDIKFKDLNNEIKASKLPREGKSIEEGKDVNLYISCSIVKKILNNNSFPQLDSYKKEWKDKGYTKCEKNRYDKSNTELGRHFHFVYKIDSEV